MNFKSSNDDELSKVFLFFFLHLSTFSVFVHFFTQNWPKVSMESKPIRLSKETILACFGRSENQ
jgi:hypothetical protein